MKTIDIKKAQFSSSREIITLEGHKTLERGPAGVGISKYHATTSGGKKAKLSNIAVIFSYIFEDICKYPFEEKYERIKTVKSISDDSVYVEFVTRDAEIYGAVYSQSSTTLKWICVEGDKEADFVEKLLPQHNLIPILFSCLLDSSPMEEFKTAFEKCLKAKKEEELELEDLLLLCDSFYYEYSYNKLPEEVTVVAATETDELTTKMAIRSGGFTSYIDLENISKVYIEELKDGKTSSASADDISSTDEYKKIKEGFYNLDYVFDDLAHIPNKKILDGFVPSESYYSLVKLINSELHTVLERMNEGVFGIDAIEDNYVNAILVGKPGTGKTTLANALGATFGMPVRTITVSKNAEEDLYQGMTKVSEGGFKFVSTPFLDVYKNGGIILLEEFNLSDPAVLMGSLGQAIEKPFILYEDGYKEVRRHPLCVIISTMNTGTQGSREPSEAFTSRSPDVFTLDDPDEKQFLEILEKRGNEKADCQKVYNAYKKVINYLLSPSVNAEDVALSITMRHCLAALRQVRIGTPLKKAIINTIIGSIAIKDLRLANEVKDSIVEPMRD